MRVYLAFVAFTVIVCMGGIVAEQYHDAQESKAAMENGYEQVIESGFKVWKKSE